MTEKRAIRFGSKQIIPLAAAAVAGVFIYLGLTEYHFWDPLKGPRPGFFPVIIGVALLAASVLAFALSFREEAPEWPAKNWLVPLSVIAIMGATFLIGLLPSIAVYLIVWLRWFEKYSWKTTLIAFAVTMAIVMGAFVLWLGVPFPHGLVYDAIMY